MKRVFCVTDYGARANDEALQTQPIQAAIDACFLAGGGEVTIPAGTYSVASLRLRSHVTLHLLEHAILLGSRNPEDYSHFCDDPLEPLRQTEAPSISSGMLSRWCHAVIRAYFAEDIRIIGEDGSVIDGQNCYDSEGEEGYRGPHAIVLCQCERVELRGYTIVNSANWAHCIVRCRDLHALHLTMLGGHDGMHFRHCDNILVEDSTFATGDDCIAGFDNLHMVILRCALNSSCSAFRLGGTDILIDHCHVAGPGQYGHRWKMSEEEKRAGAPTNDTHRHNMLTGFLYFCYGQFPLRATPGNIVIQYTDFEQVDCLFALDFDQHLWCTNRSLHDITFAHCRVSGVCEPMRMFSCAREPLTFRMMDSSVSWRDGTKPQALLIGHDIEKLEFRRVSAIDFGGDADIIIRSHEPSAPSPIVVLQDCDHIKIIQE